MRNTSVIRFLTTAAMGLLLGFMAPTSTASAAPAAGAHAARKKHHHKRPASQATNHGKAKDPKPAPAPTGEL